MSQKVRLNWMLTENVSCVTPRASEDPEYAETLRLQQVGPTARGAATRTPCRKHHEAATTRRAPRPRASRTQGGLTPRPAPTVTHARAGSLSLQASEETFWLCHMVCNGSAQCGHKWPHLQAGLWREAQADGAAAGGRWSENYPAPGSRVKVAGHIPPSCWCTAANETRVIAS